MSLRVDSAGWHRIIYNAKLVAGSKQPVVLSYADSKLSVSVSDGSLALRDEIEALPDSDQFPAELVIAPDWLRQVEGELRGYGDGSTHLEYWHKLRGGPMITMTSDAGADIGYDFEVEVPADVTYEAQVVLDVNNWADLGYNQLPVHLWGDKLAKLNLVQPRDYPVMLDQCAVNGVVAVIWSKGHAYGLLAPVTVDDDDEEV